MKIEDKDYSSANHEPSFPAVTAKIGLPLETASEA